MFGGSFLGFDEGLRESFVIDGFSGSENDSFVDVDEMWRGIHSGT